MLFPLLALFVTAEPRPSTDFPVQAEVKAETLPVFDEANVRSFSSGQLHKGELILVRDADTAGWLTIDPPDGAFDWIEQSALEPGAQGPRVRVAIDHTSVRSGAAGALMPGPPVHDLKRGELVLLVDHPPLPIKVGNATQTWRAIAPPSGRIKYVRADGVQWPPRTKLPVPETQAAYVEDGPAVDLRTELAQAEALHRSILRNPLEEWRLEKVKDRYEALLKQVADSDTGSLIRERLNTIARQTEMAQDARTIATLLARSRRRDRDIALVRRRLAAASPEEANPYDAVGLVQPSARRVEGEKVFALIGNEGDPVAYIKVPPGLDARGFLARRVGVRGEVRFDEHLHARVIAVHDLEPLKEDR